MDFRSPFPFGSSRVTASAIEGTFLEQYDPSEVDSLLERIRALALRLPPSPECEALIAKVGALILRRFAQKKGAARSVAAGAVEEREGAPRDEL